MLNKTINKPQPETRQDEVLIREYCRGNQLAFEALYQRHRDSLYRFILKQCHNQTALCEEIFQDVWLSLIKNSQQFRADAKFSTYLYQVTRNKIIDHFRKQNTHHEHAHDEYNDDDSVSHQQQPDEQTQLTLCIELLQQSVQKLPPDQKEVFILKQETEYSLEELANITHSTIETVKSRLRYAINKLRDWLPGECL